MTSNYKKLKLPDGSTKDEHRLLVERKLGRSLSKNEIVHHINGDKSDNRLKNLAVLNRYEHGRLHMTGRRLPSSVRAVLSKVNRGSKNPAAKLTEKGVRLIRRLLATGEDVHELAGAFGVSPNAIRDIQKGRKWKHLL